MCWTKFECFKIRDCVLLQRDTPFLLVVVYPFSLFSGLHAFQPRYFKCVPLADRTPCEYVCVYVCDTWPERLARQQNTETWSVWQRPAVVSQLTVWHPTPGYSHLSKHAHTLPMAPLWHLRFFFSSSPSSTEWYGNEISLINCVLFCTAKNTLKAKLQTCFQGLLFL